MSALAHEVDLDVAQLVLDVVSKKVRGLDTRIENSLVDGSLERTMDGASTLSLSVHDPKRVLLRSGVFGTATQPTTIETKLDSFAWRLAQLTKSDDELTMTFEDREVALLRQVTKPRKASRTKMTRAEFALSLVRETLPHTPFVCPELHVVKQIVSDTGGKGDVRKLRKALPYQFKRGGADGEVEDTWACLQRLADEVNWRCFATAGSIYFVSETALLKAAPIMDLSETTPGVTTIDFDLDSGKLLHECTISARANRWAARPGSVVKLHDMGIADGTWLVSNVRRGIYDADATITLKRASKPLKEPAPDSTSVAKTQRLGLTGGVSGGASAAWDAAQSINDKHFPYVWGGGHGAAGVPSGNPPGFDCSGSVCAVLAAAGYGFRPGGPVDVSGALESWGVAGPGQQLTVYCNAIHTFIFFHTAKGDVHFGTGDWGKGWGGAGFNPNLHPTAGFTARHWPGT